MSFLTYLIQWSLIEWSLWLCQLWELPVEDRGRSTSWPGILLQTFQSGVHRNSYLSASRKERTFGKTAQVLVNMYVFDFRAHLCYTGGLKRFPVTNCTWLNWGCGSRKATKSVGLHQDITHSYSLHRKGNKSTFLCFGWGDKIENSRKNHEYHSMFQKFKSIQVCKKLLLQFVQQQSQGWWNSCLRKTFEFLKFQTAKAQTVAILQDSSATATLLAWVIFWATFYVSQELNTTC